MAGQGTAAAAVKALGARGARIGVFDRHPDRAAATVEGLKADGHEAIALTVDVGVEADVMKAGAAIAAQFGGIDILINGAGSYGKRSRKTHDTPVEEWDDVFASNVRANLARWPKSVI